MVQKIIVRSGIYRIYGIFGIRSRDREIAPTEEGSAVSGQGGRDREIDPTEEGSAVSGQGGRDREIAPTERGVSGHEESRSGDRSYRRGELSFGRGLVSGFHRCRGLREVYFGTWWSCLNARCIWSSAPQIVDWRGFHRCRGLRVVYFGTCPFLF